MLTINRNSSEPIYLQLRGHLIRQIQTSKLQPGGRLPSVRDLSRQLGVAPLTVWNAVKALSNEGILSSNGGRGTFVTDDAPALLAAAEDVRQGRNGNGHAGRKVALILPNLGDPLAANISRGVRAGLVGDDWSISVFDTHDDGAVEVDCLRRLRDEGMAGAIVHPTGDGDASAEICRAVLDGVRLVLVDRFLQDVPCWHVTSDNHRGGCLAAAHLIDRGRRRIAMVSGTLHAVTVRERLRGFLETMGQRGVPVYYNQIVDTEGPSATVAGAVAELLALPEPPDGFFFGNDYDAMAGMQAIKAAGRLIPRDVSVVGFDGHPLGEVFEPALTTVRQDGLALGRSAAELLAEHLTRPTPERGSPADNSAAAAQGRVVPVELVVRQSS